MNAPDPDARRAWRRRNLRRIGHVEVWLGLWGLLFTLFAWFGARRAPPGAHAEAPGMAIALFFIAASLLSMLGGVATVRGWRPPPLWLALALPLLGLLAFLLVSLHHEAVR